MRFMYRNDEEKAHTIPPTLLDTLTHCHSVTRSLLLLLMSKVYSVGTTVESSCNCRYSSVRRVTFVRVADNARVCRRTDRSLYVNMMWDVERRYVL